eukprot:scaffold1204_cov407-Prasinococcus_capsulatus_cf.AAC.2
MNGIAGKAPFATKTSCRALSNRIALVARGISKEMLIDAPDLMYSSCMPQSANALGYPLMDETKWGLAVFKMLPEDAQIVSLKLGYAITRPGGYFAYNGQDKSYVPDIVTTVSPARLW